LTSTESETEKLLVLYECVVFGFKMAFPESFYSIGKKEG